MSNSRPALCCLLCRRTILCARLPIQRRSRVCERHKEPCAEAKKDTARLLGARECAPSTSISLPGIRNARATAPGLSKGNFLAYKIKVPLWAGRLIIKFSVCCFYLQVLYPGAICVRLRNRPWVAQLRSLSLSCWKSSWVLIERLGDSRFGTLRVDCLGYRDGLACRQRLICMPSVVFWWFMKIWSLFVKYLTLTNSATSTNLRKL